MSRLLKLLEEFDDNVTVGQIIKKIKGDQESNNKEEESTFRRIKKEYGGSYLKVFDDCPLYGRNLDIYFIEEITSKERTTDWDLVYMIKGKRLNFSKRNIIEKNMSGTNVNDTFSESDLEEMTKISKEEFEEYVSKYTEIKDKLAKIIE